MERYIAVDSVCAWPNLTLLPGGEIVATIFNQPCHGLWTGDVECWVSADEGRAWSRRGVPAPHDPSTNRMNVAAGLARNGDLLVLASGWSNRPEKGQAQRSFEDSAVLPCRICRSKDGGRTWTQAETVAIPPDTGPLIPFGKIICLPDGSLGVSMYSERKVNGMRLSESWFCRSLDDGQSWGLSVLIGSGLNETDLLCPDGARLLAAARTRREGRLDLRVSEDLGRTWTLQEPLTAAGEHPAHPLQLRDGSTLLTYGIRHRGFFGIGARLSEDAGRSWYTPWALVTLDDAYDGGYPASVEASDSTLVTAYYASGVGAHARYHMGVARWTIKELAARNQPKPQTF
jgi:hypothetical protein